MGNKNTWIKRKQEITQHLSNGHFAQLFQYGKVKLRSELVFTINYKVSTLTVTLLMWHLLFLNKTYFLKSLFTNYQNFIFIVNPINEGETSQYSQPWRYKDKPCLTFCNVFILKTV